MNKHINAAYQLLGVDPSASLDEAESAYAEGVKVLKSGGWGEHALADLSEAHLKVVANIRRDTDGEAERRERYRTRFHRALTLSVSGLLVFSALSFWDRYSSGSTKFGEVISSFTLGVLVAMAGAALYRVAKGIKTTRFKL